LARSFKRRVFDGNSEFDRLRGVVVDVEQLISILRRLAQARGVSVVPADVPLLAGTQSGVSFAQRQQRLHVREYILLFGGTAAGGEGVVQIARAASPETASQVGIVAAVHRNFVAGINLGNSAQRQQQ